jgi:hypothetical protein
MSAEQIGADWKLSQLLATIAAELLLRDVKISTIEAFLTFGICAKSKITSLSRLRDDRNLERCRMP